MARHKFSHTSNAEVQDNEQFAFDSSATRTKKPSTIRKLNGKTENYTVFGESCCALFEIQCIRKSIEIECAFCQFNFQMGHL